MTTFEARSLVQGDPVTWMWGDATNEQETPGTVTATDADGIEIYWADSAGYPTRYDYDEPAFWSHVEKHHPQLVYVPDIEHRAPAPRRRKKKK